MRRSYPLFVIPLAAALILTQGGCKPVPPSAEKETPPSPVLMTMLHTANPDASPQLIEGFHEVEDNAWRWTKGRFSVRLRPPAGAAGNGAVLVFRFTLPESVVRNVNEVRLSAKVESTTLSPETYDKPGEYVYSRTVPPGILSGDSARVDFELDKFLAAGSVDVRELGVVATIIGFEVR